MMTIRLILCSIALFAGSKASGFGHLVPSVRSVPVVRYAPFYNFPNGVRSLHAVAAPIPAPFLPAPAPAPFLPAPAPFLPAPAPFLPAPAPFLPAPAPLLPAPAPIFPPPAPFLPAPTQFLPSPYAAPSLPAPPTLFTPALTRVAPAPTPFIRALPFSPIIRPVNVPFIPPSFRTVAPAFPPPVLPQPLLAPAPVQFTRAIPHVHLYNRFLNPAPILNAGAW